MHKLDFYKRSVSTSYPGLFASAVGWSAKKALASAGLFCNLIGQYFEYNYSIYGGSNYYFGETRVE
jgi:hypothetical protein